MNAYEAILEALLARGRTGQGAAIAVSMFDAMAEWMTVPLLQHEGGSPPKRIGLAHPSISPYGVFKTRDGADILISIQNDREWRVLAEKVMGDKALAADPRFATNVERMKRRPDTDGRVAAVVRHARRRAADGQARGRRDRVRPRQRAGRSGAASRICAVLPSAPPGGPIDMPAPAAQRAGEVRNYGPVPALGEHTDRIKAEFKSKSAS